jgi:alpha/beta superfamily hydrolase
VADSEEVGFKSTDGLTIEAVLDGPPDPTAVLVFCHPHPQMGGTMNAPLLLAIGGPLLELGWSVLRFNFRGIGSSEGESGIGVEELKDAEGAVAFAKGRFPDAPIAIAGWSFGGAVAVKTAMQHPELFACVGIAPAVEPKEGVTAGLPSASEVDISMPLLFVVGINDRQVDPAACRAWSEEAGAALVEMKGANHFFWGKYDDLSENVVGFLEDALKERG